jgi:hypothetical protein
MTDPALMELTYEQHVALELLDDDDPDDECEGHESLDGEHMGETVYCDGTCRH